MAAGGPAPGAPDPRALSLRLSFPGTGRPAVSFAADPDRIVSLGRAVEGQPQPDVPLQHDEVSRKQAQLSIRDGAWHFRRTGQAPCAIDGAVVRDDAWVRFGHGAMLSVGPYRMRAQVGDAPSAAGAGETVLLSDAPGDRPEPIPRQHLESASLRLSALLAAARRIGACDDEATVAAAAVASLTATGDFDRVGVLRAEGDGWVPVATDVAHSGSTLPWSGTLLRESRRSGGMVRLERGVGGLGAAASVMASGAQEAVCAPITGSHGLFLYADTRGGGRIGESAVPFADLVAQLAGLALTSSERRAMQSELQQARRIQERLLPSQEGALGHVSWALYSQPASRAAGAAERPSGDFFTVIDGGDGRIAAVIGDVAGKGAGAAMVMASSVAHLDATFRAGGGSARSLRELSEFFARRPSLDFSLSVGGFSTAIAVEFGPGGACSGVDAGHCYAAIVHADGRAERMEFPGRATMIGYQEGVEFSEDRFALSAGDRVVLFSDGVVDQVNRQGDRFCEDYEGAPGRVLAALHGSRSAAEDVERLVSALEAWAGGRQWGDDVTIASLVPGIGSAGETAGA